MRRQQEHFCKHMRMEFVMMIIICCVLFSAIPAKDNRTWRNPLGIPGTYLRNAVATHHETYFFMDKG